jgi:hypothetical protein
MNAIHKGRLSVIVKIICLDAVNTYGNRPKKLFIAININKEINIKELPLNDSGPISTLNSLCSFIKILLIKINLLLGVSQNIGVIIIINIIALPQFKGRLKIEEGSKTENRLVIIIFNLN